MQISWNSTTRIERWIKSDQVGWIGLDPIGDPPEGVLERPDFTPRIVSLRARVIGGAMNVAQQIGPEVEEACTRCA
jgi:hypothetical protein